MTTGPRLPGEGEIPKIQKSIETFLGIPELLLQLQTQTLRKTNNILKLLKNDGRVLVTPELLEQFTEKKQAFCSPSFIYADDRATLATGRTKKDVEARLQKCLEELSSYYATNKLKPNPGKTVSCIYHLNNRKSKETLDLNWNGAKIEHDVGPKYLGVTLDRKLSFKQHCLNTAAKIRIRNNLLSKLTATTWGANPHVLQTTGLALCFPVGEYACPLWLDSAHCKKVDIALNETCRKVTGCLRSTPIDTVYNLAGIAPPMIRRSATAV